jgi:hypothetical protein
VSLESQHPSQVIWEGFNSVLKTAIRNFWTACDLLKKVKGKIITAKQRPSKWVGRLILTRSRLDVNNKTWQFQLLIKLSVSSLYPDWEFQRPLSVNWVTFTKGELFGTECTRRHWPEHTKKTMWTRWQMPAKGRAGIRLCACYQQRQDMNSFRTPVTRLNT